MEQEQDEADHDGESQALDKRRAEGTMLRKGQERDVGRRPSSPTRW